MNSCIARLLPAWLPPLMMLKAGTGSVCAQPAFRVQSGFGIPAQECLSRDPEARPDTAMTLVRCLKTNSTTFHQRRWLKLCARRQHLFNP